MKVMKIEGYEVLRSRNLIFKIKDLINFEKMILNCGKITSDKREDFT